MQEKTAKSKDELLELVIVIMLGITAVATAWSSWQGGLHGSQMDQKYTMSTNLASEGNSEYNAAIQVLMSDTMLYNEINNLRIDLTFADYIGDEDEVEKLGWKIDELMAANASEEFSDSMEWAIEIEEQTGISHSPFDMEGFTESYFEYAIYLLEESEAMLEAGNENNTHSDNQGLVSVLYAVVLFILGITNTFKGVREKYILLIIAGIGFISATIFMFTIPIVMP